MPSPTGGEGIATGAAHADQSNIKTPENVWFSGAPSREL